VLSFHSADMSFINFGKKFGSPIPLRRTLSLMRMDGCQSIVVQEEEWLEGCNEGICGHRHQSCLDYVENLPKYNYELINKKCYKMLFFNSMVSNENELIIANNDSLLGFCIVHNDIIINGEGKQYLIPYVTESCLKSPLKFNAFILPPSEVSIKVNGREFKLQTNYFSQQNGITNCCAHAAIKMAIRGYYPQFTSEIINKKVPIDHIERKGNKGLAPDEISKVIEELSENETYLLSSTDLSSSAEFLRLVYISLESRLPVILLFNLPEKGFDIAGHAVTLIGHTFNEHNWSSYGLKGYFRGDDVRYLPSSLWCDNLVVHDDNWGPYYLVTIRFLTDAADLSYILSAVEEAIDKVMASSLTLPIRLGVPIDPVTAIIVYPKHMSFIKDGLLVEPYAIARLNQYISAILVDDSVLKCESFHQYFLDYQKDNDLILRTFCLSKSEYLQFNHDNLLYEGYEDKIDEYLPDTFWLTEISIPELYWVNRKKVGEIITDPKKFNRSREHGVIFIHLPGLISFLENDEFITINIQDNRNYYDLITPTGLSQFKNP